MHDTGRPLYFPFVEYRQQRCIEVSASSNSGNCLHWSIHISGSQASIQTAMDGESTLGPGQFNVLEAHISRHIFHQLLVYLVMDTLHHANAGPKYSREAKARTWSRTPSTPSR